MTTRTEKFENIAQVFLDEAMEQAEDNISVSCAEEGVQIDDIPDDGDVDQWTIEGVTYELVPPQVKRIS